VIRDLDSAYYFLVMIFPTRRQMTNKHLKLSLLTKRRYAKGVADRMESGDWHSCAFVMPRKVWNTDPTKWYRKYFLGFVLLNQQDMNAELLVHESVHIALEYLRRIKCSTRLRKEVDDQEEHLAYTVGIFATQLATHINRHNLWQHESC